MDTDTEKGQPTTDESVFQEMRDLKAAPAADKGHRHERHPQLKQGYHIRCAFCDEWHGLEWWDAYEQGLKDAS